MSIENNINRRINIIMPYSDPIIAYVQYIQTTKDGRYILNYLEQRRGNISPNFTEITKIDGKWCKSPFHLDYEDYEFEAFNNELSKKIISELPDNMKIRIIINDDRKKINHEEEKNKIEINSLGVTEIIDKIDQDLYYVLISNSSEDIINNNDYYPYELPFPSFALEGKDNHLNANYESDSNKGIDFNELEFSRYGLSLSFRKQITDFIKNQKNVIRINDLPTLELEDDDEKLRVHFINCPEISTFNNIYKAKTIFIDCDYESDLSVTDLFKKALNDQIPYYFESELGTKKDNEVKHKGHIK